MKKLSNKTHRKVGKSIRTGLLIRWGLVGALTPLATGAGDLSAQYNALDNFNQEQSVKYSNKDNFNQTVNYLVAEKELSDQANSYKNTKQELKGGLQ